MKKAFLILALILASALVADENIKKASVKTLVIASHPYPERSVIFKGLQEAAKSVQGVSVRNLEELYGYDTRAIDGQTERKITQEYERIVFLFPTHWFNITPMMKAYLNETWGSVGPGLWQGKQMLVVSAAGGGDSTYGKNGRIGMELAEVFTPMKASALHCGMEYLAPLVFKGASAQDLPNYQSAFIKRLSQN
ncbi:MAG: NAD(P)H-dependent oxidoreductase [Campylobacter sp.]|nr:NAD(P)H-dependent oxidoreductase [Campylobacter sp.]